jgi:Cytochrome c554 and c-prime
MCWLRWVGAGIIISLLVLLWPASGQNHPVPIPPMPAPAAAVPTSEFQGAGSCSAIACHGSIAPIAWPEALRTERTKRNEHTTWITADPHSGAYKTLFKPEAEQIVKRLVGGNKEVVPADQNERCLACHTTPRPAPELKNTVWMNQDGVGCESCHGAAATWLGPHTTVGWEKLDPGIKEQDYKLIPTKNLVRRVEVCVGCHVGRRSADGLLVQDVNHDLIAAGHPRLNFEFAAYQDNLPPHWDEKGRNSSPDFPARAWMIGQVVSAKASLKLLQGRADKTLSATWPEFSEYDCFSCHHNLADEAWRRSALDSVGQRGTAPWGSWYFPMTRALAESRIATIPSGDKGEFVTPYQELLKLMNQPVPDQAKIAPHVDDCIALIDRELDGLSMTVLEGPTVERLICGFDCDDAWQSVGSWDHATQRYLALVALRQAWERLDRNQREEQERLGIELKELLRKLQFKEDQNSPSAFNPARVIPAR